MTNDNNLNSLKTIAKRFARQQRIAHHTALDAIANGLEFPHWNALTVAWQKGWRPDPAKVDAFTNASNVGNTNPQSRPPIGLGFATVDRGSIDGHEYTIEIDFEVLMGGRGWAICVEQAPSEELVIEMYGNSKDNPIRDSKFREKALKIANEAAEVLRARIASDWPRRSTKPDAEGRVIHPLWADSEPSSKWFCLHCDGAFTGAQMATNMWHCPDCSATPVDIFVQPFWKAAS